MTDVAETWMSRERPILQAALRCLDEGASFPRLEEIRAQVGLDVTQMRAGLKALESAYPPYIECRYTLGGRHRVGGFVTSVSERARRELGAWPSAQSLVDELAAAFCAAAEAETAPQQKRRLRAGAEALAGVGRDLAVAVLAAKLGTVAS